MESAVAIASGLDLNLLRVLVALDAARNVSRAADLLGMSQSGFSTALARLREQFGDEMFIRAAGAMQPTSRAQRMLGPAREILLRVSEDILGKPVFEPTATATEFRLAMADVAEAIYLPQLLAHFAEHAPQVTVVTGLPAGDGLRQAMAAGEIDLAVGYFPDLETQQFFKQKLYMHTYACIARNGHPMGPILTLDAYQRCGHAVAATPSRSTALLDKFLARKRIERKVVLKTPHHLALPGVVAGTDLIATVPMAVAGHLADAAPIQVFPLPFLPPRFAVQQHWHRAVHKDPRTQWLRAQVHALFSASSSQWSALDEALYGRRMRARS
jgi:DNA-binding transcriptional LysR family regulator